MRLPDRFAYWPKVGREDSELLPSEEIASLWLWSWPQLLGWPRTVNWLFSPVVGNRIYPGDLWGVDSRGKLIIVETKTDRARSRTNPFEDFVPYSESSEAKILWRAESLHQRWLALWKRETVFLENHLSTLDHKKRLRGKYPGVVPYSRHRDAVWRWQDVYRDLIAPRFLSGRYERSIDRGLRLRRQAGDPPPIFVGLVATVREGDPRLSGSGRKDLFDLRAQLGRQRVFYRAIRAGRGVKKIRFHSWSPGGA
ncbi:MAG: hypothetical protein ACREX3_11720 [Gammaproteobacteria bacterium]